MKNYLLLAGGLASPLLLRAQSAVTPAPPPTYQVQHDSLWARAQRVRTETAARTVTFRPSFASIGGTRRVVTSLGEQKQRPLTDVGSRIVFVKREVVKHKTHGAEIKKIAYYGGADGLRLYEYYEGGQLVQLELYSYPVAGGAGGHDFCTMRWLRGDYLSVKLRANAIGGRLLQQQSYVAPVAPPN